MKKWGLVLSGGIAYGMANAGVLEAFEEEGLKPDSIGGSSMGAIVAGLYALGIPVSDMRVLAHDMKMYDMAEPSFHSLKEGLHGGFLRQKLKKHIGPLVGDAVIGDCNIPFVCVAGKLLKPIQWHKIIKDGFTMHAMQCVEKYVFPDDTRMLDALLATSAIPVVFSPVTIGNDSFIDLCHFGAVPARTMRDLMHPDIVVATNTVPRTELIENMLPKSWKQFIDDGMDVTEESLSTCDMVIHPDMVALPFRFDKANAFMDAGKDAAMKHMDDLKRLLA